MKLPGRPGVATEYKFNVDELRQLAKTAHQVEDAGTPSRLRASSAGSIKGDYGLYAGGQTGYNEDVDAIARPFGLFNNNNNQDYNNDEDDDEKGNDDDQEDDEEKDNNQETDDDKGEDDVDKDDQDRRPTTSSTSTSLGSLPSLHIK